MKKIAAVGCLVNFILLDLLHGCMIVEYNSAQHFFLFSQVIVKCNVNDIPHLEFVNQT